MRFTTRSGATVISENVPTAMRALDERKERDDQRKIVAAQAREKELEQGEQAKRLKQTERDEHEENSPKQLTYTRKPFPESVIIKESKKSSCTFKSKSNLN